MYQTEVWQARLPDGWEAKEIDGQAYVAFFRPGVAGKIEVIATDDEEWSDRHLECSGPEAEVADFHGKLPGRTRAWTDEDSAFRMWKLFFPGGTLYVRYRCAACDPELQGSEVEAIVQSLSGSCESLRKGEIESSPSPNSPPGEESPVRRM
jgi:hypothetical protein